MLQSNAKLSMLCITDFISARVLNSVLFCSGRKLYIIIFEINLHSSNSKIFFLKKNTDSIESIKWFIGNNYLFYVLFSFINFAKQ